VRRLKFLLLVAAMLLTPLIARAADQTVTIDNFVFTPNRVTVAAGTRVIFINRDDIPHTVVGIGAGNFKSPPLDTDDKFSVTFDRTGTYKYFCSLHPMMTGTIVVR
jgi:plastocyanin